MNDSEKFLKELWPDELPGHCYIWTAPDRKTYSFDNVADAADKAVNCNGHDVYVGMGISSRALKPHERCKAGDVVAIPGLWADVDIAGPGHKGDGLFADKDEVKKWVAGLVLQPTMVTFTGGGLHLYWLFREPAESGDYDLARIVRGWEDYLKSTTDRKIDTVSDLARVMRMPGTMNRKCGGEGVLCRIVRSGGVRYNPDDFEDYLAVESDPKLPIKRSLAGDSVADALLNYKAPLALTAAEVEAELFRLGSRWYDGGYQDWIDVMFCVHHQSGGAEWGLKLFDQWSAQAGERYCGSAKIAGHWRSVSGSGRVLTWASVRKWIKEDAEVNGALKAAEVESGKVERFLDKLKECTTKREVLALCRGFRIDADAVWEVEAAIQKQMVTVGCGKPPVRQVRRWVSGGDSIGELEVLPEWAEGWCYLRGDGLFFNSGSGEMISERAFNLSMSANCEERAASELLMGAGVLPQYSRGLYLPGAGRVFKFDGEAEYINTFKGMPSGGVEDKAKVNVILGHAQRRFPRDWRILVDYLAWCVQNPGKKSSWCPVIQGVPGDGKSFWLVLMTFVLGRDNVQVLNPVEVLSGFTDWAGGSMFSVIEEIHISGNNRYEALGKLKTYMTNDIVRIVPKGRKGYNAPNVTNYLLLTNHQEAVPIDDNDRRYCFLFSECQRREQLEGGEYFDKLYDYAVRSDCGGAARVWLKNWELSAEFNPRRAPDTSARDAAIEMAKSDVRLAIEDYMGSLASCAEISSHNIKTALTNPMSDYYCPGASSKVWGRELRDMGFVRTIRKINGRVVRFWSDGRVDDELGF